MADNSSENTMLGNGGSPIPAPIPHHRPGTVHKRPSKGNTGGTRPSTGDNPTVADNRNLYS